MTDIVRVKGPDGAEFYTTERGRVATGATLVDKPTHDEYGRLIPIKPNIHKGGTLPVSKSSKRDEIESYATEYGGMTAEEASAFSSKADLYDALLASANPSEEN